MQFMCTMETYVTLTIFTTSSQASYNTANFYPISWAWTHCHDAFSHTVYVSLTSESIDLESSSFFKRATNGDKICRNSAV